MPRKYRNDAVAVSVPAHSSRLNGGNVPFASANLAAKRFICALTLLGCCLSAYFSSISYTITLTIVVLCVFCVVSSEFHSKFNCVLNLEAISDFGSGSKFWHPVKRRVSIERVAEPLKSQPALWRHVCHLEQKRFVRPRLRLGVRWQGSLRVALPPTSLSDGRWTFKPRLRFGGDPTPEIRVKAASAGAKGSLSLCVIQES